MPTVACSAVIAAPASALFALTQDYERRLRWDPFLREARLLGGAHEAALGARAWCVARNGLGMETEYVSFQPPTVVAVKMTRGPAIIGEFAGSWRFTTAATPGATQVTFRYHVAGRPRWLRPLLDPILRAIFTRETQRRLLALKRAAETTSILAATPSARRRPMSDAGRPTVVLIIGGTGVFGQLIAADLLTHTTLSVAVASRRGVGPHRWLPGSEGRLTSHTLDARDEQAIKSAIQQTGASVLVHAAGPYAIIGDAPIRAAIAARVPYVDMCPRSDLYAALRERYDAPAKAAGLACIVGASTAGGLTGLLTRHARHHLSAIEWVRSSLCVHNFNWGSGVVGDYLLSAHRQLPGGRVATHPQRVLFPGLGVRTVRLADTLDYADATPDAVRDAEYRVGLPNLLPGLGLYMTASVARFGVPLWCLARPLGMLAGVLGGSYTEGGLLHQAYGEGPTGRGTFETHVHRAFGNVRNPSLLCALAADRLARGALPQTGVIHPATWLAPEDLLDAMRARAVTIRSRFRPEGIPEHTPWDEGEE